MADEGVNSVKKFLLGLTSFGLMIFSAMVTANCDALLTALEKYETTERKTDCQIDPEIAWQKECGLSRGDIQFVYKVAIVLLCVSLMFSTIYGWEMISQTKRNTVLNSLPLHMIGGLLLLALTILIFMKTSGLKSAAGNSPQSSPVWASTCGMDKGGADTVWTLNLIVLLFAVIYTGIGFFKWRKGHPDMGAGALKRRIMGKSGATAEAPATGGEMEEAIL